MLYYGAAAQVYKEFDTANLATDGVENLFTADETEIENADFTLVNAELAEGETYGAWFAGAGVHFSNVNKIYVKLSTTENVKLVINNVEVEVTGTVVYTDAIKATGFAETYVFELYYGEELMQTLTYSVNAYAYAMQDKDTNMGRLALALYYYGASATAYMNMNA